MAKLPSLHPNWILHSNCLTGNHRHAHPGADAFAGHGKRFIETHPVYTAFPHSTRRLIHSRRFMEILLVMPGASMKIPRANRPLMIWSRLPGCSLRKSYPFTTRTTLIFTMAETTSREFARSQFLCRTWSPDTDVHHGNACNGLGMTTPPLVGSSCLNHLTS